VSGYLASPTVARNLRTGIEIGFGTHPVEIEVAPHDQMIRNGLYSQTTKLLDGLDGGTKGVSLLRDGKMLGGGNDRYHVGSYQCSGGKWKGELSSHEHTPTYEGWPWTGQSVSMGFTGTYTDDGAEYEATVLLGKQSLRLKTIFRLLLPD
jgi:hypothetical protein